MLPRRALLGATLPADAEAFVDGGVRIAGVGAGTMAESAGLAPGDLLLSLAELPVRDLCELAAALRRAGAEPTTELVYARGDQRLVSRATVIGQPPESLAGISYGELPVEGALLRTITTRVEHARGLIVVLQGIACESIDLATAPDAPLAGLVAAWAGAGFDSLRFDKRGVGDSTGGPCREIDFETELADARAALVRARALARDAPLFAFGHSVGGIVAAVLARDVDGLIVYGTPAMSWIDCLRDSTRRQLALHGAPPHEIEQRVAALDELVHAGELNGRSAAYHAGLAALDLEVAWRGVTCPLLVVRGEHDWVVRADDQARIATLARGDTTIVDVPGFDHLFGWHPDREASLRDYGAGLHDPALERVTLDWLERRARV